MNSERILGRRGEGYLVIQFLLFALIFFVPILVPKVVNWPNPWNTVGIVFGLLIGLTGGLIILAGVLSLGSSLTAVPYPKDDAELVETGVFRIVRHPIYAGIILGSLGWALLNNSLLTMLLTLVLLVFFDIKSRREEKWLCEKYSGYKAYQSRVRKLIPLIY